MHPLSQRRGGKRPYRREPGDTEGGPEDMEVDDGPGAGQVGAGAGVGAGRGRARTWDARGVLGFTL